MELKTGREWTKLLYPGYQVIDPDGWRDGASYERTLITQHDFEQRFSVSTVQYQPPVDLSEETAGGCIEIETQSGSIYRVIIPVRPAFHERRGGIRMLSNAILECSCRELIDSAVQVVITPGEPLIIGGYRTSPIYAWRRLAV